MAAPIWKDYIVDLGAPASTGAGVPFYIYSVARTATIFQGVAYPKPGASNAFARINDICADYLAHAFLEAPNTASPYRATFRVYVTTTGTAVQKAEVEFYNDWSYDPYYNPAVDGLNFPVVLTFAPGQYIPVSIWSGSVGTATIYMANGQVFTATPVQYQAADFNNDFNDDFLISTTYYGDSYVIRLQDYPGAVRVVYGTRTWVLDDKCPRYVLYYVNEHGGWDALPVDGKVEREDKVTHRETGVVYDNNLTTARSRRNYMNEVVPKYTFWTGWLDDRQSGLMHHLLNSPSVYMQEVESGIIYPLVLTNTTTPYKEERGKMKSYQITGELAQDRIRM